MSLDYTYFYKHKFSKIETLNKTFDYDCFISFYDQSARVTTVFDNILSKRKVLFYDEADLYVSKYENFLVSYNELADLSNFFSSNSFTPQDKLCLDITGFSAPYILLFLRFFQKHGIRKFDVIYSEPDYYRQKSNTKFTDDFIEVRQVDLFKGIHSTDESNDYLIVACGYDHTSIIDVCKHKENIHNKHQLFGFPSLQPDMYQENVLKINSAKSILNFENINDPEVNLFAPANDPFVTAQELKLFVEKNDKNKKITNIYLSPVSTKAQALGFGLYYIWEQCHTKSVSIIFPYCNKIHKNTSEGLSRLSLFHVELPNND